MNKKLGFYYEKVQEQAFHLNGSTIMIWLAGVAFTRLATDTWLGPRPTFVISVILALVYLHMHLGYKQTALIRFPIVLIIIYLAHAHLIHPGDFLLKTPITLSWRYVLTAVLAMNFSLLFRGDDYPFKFGHSLGRTSKFENDNVVPLSRKSIANS